MSRAVPDLLADISCRWCRYQFTDGNAAGGPSGADRSLNAAPPEVRRRECVGDGPLARITVARAMPERGHRTMEAARTATPRLVPEDQ